MEFSLFPYFGTVSSAAVTVVAGAPARQNMRRVVRVANAAMLAWIRFTT